MKKHFYFSAMICVLLSVFAFSVSADYYQPEQNAYKTQDDKKTDAQNKNTKAVEARSVMSEMGTYYNLNAQEINKGKRLTLGAALKGAATVTVTYISGGSTLTAVVPSSIATALKALGLAGSINVKSDLESAYESAISEVQSRIWSTSAAIARYSSAWTAYSLVVSGHNSSNHGGPYTYGSAHTISKYQPPSLNEGLPSFTCPGGGCSIRWTMPSDARESHDARCGSSDDPYNTSLQGCNKVYYTCNTSENSRHKPVDCGLYKWLETTHSWAETACPADYRKCMPGRIQREHSTLITGVNVTSTCGGSRPSDSTPPSENPIVSPPPPPTPPPSPTYHACGEHETSVSGDHSLQASCTSTDSNGNTCRVTSFYACDSHTHSYPSPPPPTTVACGGASYTGCSGATSRTEHHVPSCSHCNNGYWTCGQYAYRHTTQNTCRRPGCGVTYYECQNGACSSDSGTHDYHWAQ